METVLFNVCSPNCGGGFVPRPIRPVTRTSARRVSRKASGLDAALLEWDRAGEGSRRLWRRCVVSDRRSAEDQEVPRPRPPHASVRCNMRVLSICRASTCALGPDAGHKDSEKCRGPCKKPSFALCEERDVKLRGPRRFSAVLRAKLTNCAIRLRFACDICVALYPAAAFATSAGELPHQRLVVVEQRLGDRVGV